MKGLYGCDYAKTCPLTNARNADIQPFSAAHIVDIVRAVRPLWGIAERREAADILGVEYIVRHNIYENGYAVEAVRGTEFLGAAFAARQGEVPSGADAWLCGRLLNESLSDGEKHGIGMTRDYLAFMDSETESRMGSRDMRLSLFVSRARGTGGLLLKELCRRFSEMHTPALWLWTDCECSWQWYVRHGFEKVYEAAYAPFSRTDGEPYMTYIFKKTLA